MKNIIFFSRCKLAHLYGRISKDLSSHHNIIHVAFSDVEYEILSKEYHIENIINLNERLKYLLEVTKFDKEICNEIDELIISQSNGRFNLSSSLQSDRTFQYLQPEESLILCQLYYKFWSELISSKDIDFVVHEPTSLFLNHIAALVCRNNGSKYITKFIVSGINEYDFIIVSHDDCTFDELENSNVTSLNLAELELVKNYLKNFRNSYFGLGEEFNISSSFNILIMNSIKVILKKLKFLFKRNNYNILQHIDRYHHYSINIWSTLHRLWGQYFCLHYDEIDTSDEFYYYPMHLEPEAVVLYWGDGIYKDQVKLIENIAAQLPPDIFLYVKDHPHGGAYRSLSDYQKIKNIPNVKLINPSIKGKYLISNSKAVLTINGTSGFEALLLNKQVYTFGNSFYDSFSRVKKINHIKELRNVLYDNIDLIYKDDEELYIFVYKYLTNTHKGFVTYFGNYVALSGIDEVKNAKLVSRGLIEYFDKMT